MAGWLVGCNDYRDLGMFYGGTLSCGMAIELSDLRAMH